MVLAWIRFAVAALFVIIGLMIEIAAILGVYRFNYVLNRMQIAAMGDTMGLAMILIGLMIMSGWTIMTAKLCMIIAFFWLASPVAGHMVAEIEVATNPEADKEFEVMKP